MRDLTEHFWWHERWLISLLGHSGWVQPSMGRESAPVTGENSATGIWQLIDDAKASLSGSYKTYKGENLSW